MEPFRCGSSAGLSAREDGEIDTIYELLYYFLSRLFHSRKCLLEREMKDEHAHCASF